MRKVTPVFYASLLLSLIFIAWVGDAPNNLDKLSSAEQAFLQEHFDLLYLISASIILIYAIYLACSKYGDIKLGKDDDEPEYSRFSWFAMLSSADMGIGLVFWGVAEPVSHLHQPPFGE